MPWHGLCLVNGMLRLSTRSGPGPALAAAMVAAWLVVCPAGAGATPPPASQPLGLAWKLCARAIDEAERRHHIPGQLMAAMALAESGRYRADRKATFAWPWTVTSGKDNWFLPDRAAAIAKVRRLEARGVSNIDVGCMQVNLAWHPGAFADLDGAFDPETNVAYAAKHLVGLFTARRSWTLAVGLYHSATRPLQRHYQKKVFSGKRIAIAMTYGDTDPFTSGCVNALRTFQDIFRYEGAKIVGMVYGSAMEAGEIKSNGDLMKQAEALGKNLVK